MQNLWVDHLDLARCAELIAEEDLAAGVVALGGSLALLLWDLERTAAFKATGHYKSGHSPKIVSSFAPFDGTLENQD